MLSCRATGIYNLPHAACGQAEETRHSVLHGGEGAVSAVKWQGSLVAWANQKGVKIVDVETQQKADRFGCRGQKSQDER